MTGSDEGGFRPHPGDPWHPGWSEEDEAAAAASLDADDSKKERRAKKAKQQKPKRERRGRRAAREQAAEEAAAEFDPSTSAFDAVPADAVVGDTDDDPFDAVLRREGRVRRFKPAADEGGPLPAWTVDRDPDPDQVLPVEQPSWIGQTTEAMAGVEAAGFEGEADGEIDEAPVAAVGGPAGGSDPAGVDLADVDVDALLEAPDDGLIGQYGVAGSEAFDALQRDDTPTGEVEDWDAYMAGAPSVPYEESSAAVDEVVEAKKRKGRGRRARRSVSDADPTAGSAPGAHVLPDDTFDKTKKRKGRFRKRGVPDDVIDDGFIGVASEPGPEAESEEGEAIIPAAAPVTEFGLPSESPGGAAPATEFGIPSESPGGAAPATEFGIPSESPAGAEAFDAWIESAPPRERVFGGVAGRDESDGTDDVAGSLGVVDDGTPADWPVPSYAGAADESDDELRDEVVLPQEVFAEDVADFAAGAEDAATADDLESVVAAALAVIGADEDVAVEPLEVSPEGAIGGEFAADVQPDLFSGLDVSGEEEDAVASAETVADRPLVGDSAVPDEPDEVVDAEWAGDPGRIPAGWIAEIDEDEVVPPPALETADAEWPDDPTPGPWEGQTRWQAESAELFDIETPVVRPEVVTPPQEVIAVPEGYEPWQEAVEEAVAAGTDVEYPDDGTYEYEQPLLQDSPGTADALPAGFEPFPGGGAVDQFDLPEATMRAHLATNEFEEGWVTDDLDPTPDQVEDAPFPTGDDDFDEQIYAGGGTVEHRDLAAAIAEAGAEATQWQALSAAMPGMETGVLGFDDVADLGHGDDYVAPIRSNLGTRVATGLVLVGLLFGSLFVGAAAFAGFIGIMVVLGLVEFYGALRRTGYLPLSLFGVAGGVATLVVTWFHGPLAIPAGVLLTAMITFFFYAFSATRRDALSNAGLTVFGVAWIVAGVAFVIPIARAEDHVILIFAIVAVTAGADIGAFSFGRTWGKHALAPVLSPNKTTEGLAGGVLMAFVVAGAIGLLQWGSFDLASGLALGAIVAFVAPMGDLAESMIKRSLGLKDMGSILPGHGGILDRIDAFLFVIPAAWVLYESIGFLG